MKVDRQAKILTLIEEYPIETQEELAEKLVEAGFKVTQATVSRDIRELRLTKVVGENGRQRYAILSPKDPDYAERFVRVLQDGYTSAEAAGNILVVKTIIGMAMAVATALDNLEFSEIVGCVAGDDTIFVAVRSEKECLRLQEKIRKLIETAEVPKC